VKLTPGRSSETGATRGLMLQDVTIEMAGVSFLRKMGCIGWVSLMERLLTDLSFALASFAQTFLGLNQRVIQGPFRTSSLSL